MDFRVDLVVLSKKTFHFLVRVFVVIFYVCRRDWRLLSCRCFATVPTCVLQQQRTPHRVSKGVDSSLAFDLREKRILGQSVLDVDTKLLS